MKRAIIQKLYGALHGCASRIIARGEEHIPMAVRVTTQPDGDVAKMEVYGLFVHPEQWAGFQQDLLDKDDTAAVGIIREAWCVEPKPGERPSQIKPREHPSRFEAITFVFTLKDGSRFSALCRIERPANVLQKGELFLNTTENYVVGRELPQSAVEESVGVRR
jgi:hypothetical protein